MKEIVVTRGKFAGVEGRLLRSGKEKSTARLFFPTGITTVALENDSFSFKEAKAKPPMKRSADPNTTNAQTFDFTTPLLRIGDAWFSWNIKQFTEGKKTVAEIYMVFQRPIRKSMLIYKGIGALSNTNIGQVEQSFKTMSGKLDTYFSKIFKMVTGTDIVRHE